MTRQVKLAFAAIIFTLGHAMAAQHQKERVLDESAIREFVSGKTFHYELLGESRGQEQHFADGRAVWRLPDGRCFYGIWVVSEQMLCYYYGAQRYGCWSVVEGAERYRHEPLTLWGDRHPGPPVYVDRVSEEPVQCTSPQLS